MDLALAANYIDKIMNILTFMKFNITNLKYSKENLLSIIVAHYSIILNNFQSLLSPKSLFLQSHNS